MLLPSLSVGSQHWRNEADGLKVLFPPDVKASYYPLACVSHGECPELGGANGTHPVLDELV